jgi:predicted ATPase
MSQLVVGGTPAVFGIGTGTGTRGAFTDVVWGGDKDLAIHFEIEGSLKIQGPSQPVEYSITIASKVPGVPRIEEERAAWRKDKQELFQRQLGTVKYLDKTEGRADWEPVLQYISPDRPEAFALAQAIRSWSTYDFQRSQIAKRQPVKKEAQLASDGSNTATVLHWVRNEDVATFNRLESLLKSAIPEVEHLLTPPDEQGQVYIAFKEKHLPGRIPAWSLSEGSARLVATLLALFVPSPPALVAIEAPETSLHPYLMEYLADILKLGSRETQIIITTHSPFLLNYLPPESLVIVTKDKGETKVKRVRRDRALTEALKVLGLGEMWQAGHLGGVP